MNECKNCGKPTANPKFCSTQCSGPTIAKMRSDRRTMFDRNPEFKRQVIEIYQSGKFARQIADQFGISHQPVLRLLKSEGIYNATRIAPQFQSKPWTEARINQAILEQYQREWKLEQSNDNAWWKTPQGLSFSAMLNYRKDPEKTKRLVNARDRRNALNPHLRIKKALRTRIWKMVTGKGYVKADTTMQMIGCDVDTLRNHLQSKFTNGMNWTNYGRWEVDHIKPCSAFDLSRQDHQHECFHFTNLQPLWSTDNRSKGGMNRACVRLIYLKKSKESYHSIPLSKVF